MRISNTFYLVKEKKGSRYLSDNRNLMWKNKLSYNDLHTNFQQAKEFSLSMAEAYRDRANKAQLISILNNDERPVFEVVKKTVEIELTAI